MKILVTGAAGFIGYHVARKLLESRRCEVLGVDNCNDYYSVELKQARLKQLEAFDDFRFIKLDIGNAEGFRKVYDHFKPDYVVHLAAQAGVRHSIENPEIYAQSNLVGFLNVLEACRAHPPKHVVFASSSSIYGAKASLPFTEDQITDQPLSFYGATKKANELMAYSYAHAYGLRITGLRYFTVYGPWGRPDMSPVIFSHAIQSGSPLRLFNEGKSLRDFTYIEDVVSGTLKVLLYPPKDGDHPPYRVYNLGHHRPIEVRLFVEMLESILGKKANVELLPAQLGDMPSTCASIDRIREAVGYEPRTSLEDGLKAFASWYLEYYRPASTPDATHP